MIEPQPLLLKPGTTELVYPNNTNNIIYLERGQSLELSCRNAFTYPNFNKTILATCESNKTFSVAEGLYEFNTINCTQDAFYEARRTTRKCFNNATVVEVGFEIDETKFLSVINICFDEIAYRPLYSQYNFVPANSKSQLSIARPSFVQGSFFEGRDINNLYTGVTQRNTIAGILNSTDLAAEYIKDSGSSDYFLARGHLAAKADFIYGPAQKATFFFINIAPQWQTFNGGNWEKLETRCRNLVAEWNVDFVVYTGTYGVTTLKDANGVEHEIYLDEENGVGRVPVPKVYYRILHHEESKSGIVIIGVNNPYVTVEEINRDYVICPDLSDQVSFLDMNLRDLKGGYMYACDYNEFIKVVDHLPEMNIVNVMLKSPNAPTEPPGQITTPAPTSTVTPITNTAAPTSTPTTSISTTSIPTTSIPTTTIPITTPDDDDGSSSVVQLSAILVYTLIIVNILTYIYK